MNYLSACRKVSVLILISLFCLTANVALAGGDKTGNGGDPLALEFKLALYRAMDDLKTQDLHLDLQRLFATARAVRILIVEEALNVPYADSAQASAAENLSSQNLIKINRGAWNAISDPNIKQALALHEVLSLLGVEGTADYSISQVYLSEKSGLRFDAESANSAKISSPCGPPGAGAAELFKVLSDTKTTAADLEQFIRGHAVAPDALNLQCMTPLMYALAVKREDLFRTLYAFYPNVNLNAVQSLSLPIKDRKTLFYYVVGFGSSTLIDELRSKGGDVNPFLKEMFGVGATEFMVAATYNSAEVVKNYIARGVDVNAEIASNRISVLLAAVSANKPDVVQELIRAGADVRHTDSAGRNAMMIAAKSSLYPEILRVLANAGLDVNSEDTNGGTALFYTLNFDPLDYEMVKTLAALKANLEVKMKVTGVRALMLGAYNNSVYAIRALIESKADINAGSLHNSTALHFAAGVSVDTSAAISELVSAGANVNAIDETGQSPLFKVPLPNTDHELDRFRALCTAGSDLNIVDSNGFTALMYAAQYSTAESIKYLISRGANRSIVSHDNTSAWSIAKAVRRPKEILDLLYTNEVKRTGQSVVQSKKVTQSKPAKRSKHSTPASRPRQSGPSTVVVIPGGSSQRGGCYSDRNPYCGSQPYPGIQPSGR